MHLNFKCVGGSHTFNLTIRSFNFGGGLGGGIAMPTGMVAGRNKQEVMQNISGWSVFANVFPPALPVSGPAFGLGGNVGTNPVYGGSHMPISSAATSPGYGFEVSAGGSYSWISD